MLWQGRRESSNVEDRRGISGGHIVAGGGIVGVIILLVKFFLGGNGTDSQLTIPDQNQPLTPKNKQHKTRKYIL